MVLYLCLRTFQKLPIILEMKAEISAQAHKAHLSSSPTPREPWLSTPRYTWVTWRAGPGRLQSFWFGKTWVGLNNLHFRDLPDDQWLKRCTPNAGSPEFKSWSGNSIPHAATDPACCN